ncbi:HTH-type transcriptional regulator [Quillaja saponaria]|uniref:HTH-type transcriptional regulator n=1 Tax=Quillaja saponaria TaxID=32244 RepID=A0AAD7KRD9_QUISA|nr:HTH-type transcriptional regulator [Quillaja saponaria]
MGNCKSSDSTQLETAKLILQDGRLQQYPHPVRVSYLLQKYPMCFICNSDEMDFDDVVIAINENDELQPGQLYFALPLSRLQHRLQAEEMAALAVKATSALMKLKSNVGDKKRGCCGKYLMSSGEDDVKSYRRVAPGDGDGDGGGGLRRGRRGGGRRNSSAAILSAIPE